MTVALAGLFSSADHGTRSCGCLHRERARKRVAAPGDRFGRLTVLHEMRLPPTPAWQEFRPGGLGQMGALCRCDCGTEVIVRLSHLFAGSTRSCGCLWREQAREHIVLAIAAASTHGLYHHPLYPTWKDMLQRCENPRSSSYRWYGARGISVCERWHDPAVFIADIERLLGPRPAGMTLDRADNDGDYEPGNVRWADAVTQTRNRRLVLGSLGEAVTDVPDTQMWCPVCDAPVAGEAAFDRHYAREHKQAARTA